MAPAAPGPDHSALSPSAISANAPAEAPILLEVGWEVCNQVGGIYQVLRSKAPIMVDRWGERYCLIGPWNAQTAALEFEEATASGPIGAAVEALRAEGLNVRHGRWMISGRPRCILIDHWQGTQSLDRTKFRLWNDHKIPSPVADPLIDGVISFAEAVRRVVEKITHHPCSRTCTNGWARWRSPCSAISAAARA
jgi:glycogen(starch) synthase